MAYYKDATHLQQNNDANFDLHRHPGTQTPYSGIYRCVVCGHEVVSTHQHPLPPQNHHQHANRQQITWQLLVAVHIPQ